MFFCFELTQSFGFGPPYTYDDSIQSGGKYDTLSELFTEAFATSTASPLNSVAFQLAVWEILEETTPGSLSPGIGTQGTFYVTNDHGNTATVTAANALIAGLPSTGLYQIHLLHNDNSQDFVYGTLPLRQQVPEPAPLMLIGAAMIALFAIRRRAGCEALGLIRQAGCCTARPRSTSGEAAPSARASPLHFPQRSASGFNSPASSSRPARVAGCSGSSGWRTASLRMTPPAAITVLVARSPHWRFS